MVSCLFSLPFPSDPTLIKMSEIESVADSVIPKNLPQGFAGFCAGFVSGYMLDKLAAYIYLTYVPADKRPELPIFAPDDWLVFGLCALVTVKNSTFGMGMFAGALLSSGALF